MSGARKPVDPTERGAARQTVTIHFAGFNRAWAAWIGDRLERRGQRVVYLRWESPADVPLVDLLRDLKLAEGRILIVVSDWYFQLGPRTHEEWNEALREVVAPDPSRFAAVSVTTATIPSAAAVLAPVALTNMGAEEAERRLLDRLDLPSEPLSEPPPPPAAARASRPPCRTSGAPSPAATPASPAARTSSTRRTTCC
ncbi:ATP-binding protein OS=Streptomyces fumanus OX=67302 GN=GCM10018772_50660 PE=4 SV=1 [Streptomyces fumanus]